MLGDTMSTVQTQIQSVSGGGLSESARTGYWISGPVADLVLILVTPLPILATFALARRGARIDWLIAFLLVLATAHYLPGLLRAYGDKALFKRFRFRLIAAPLF